LEIIVILNQNLSGSSKLRYLIDDDQVFDITGIDITGIDMTDILTRD